MRPPKLLIAAVILLVVSVCGATFYDEAIAAPQEDSVFADRIVTVYVDDPMNGSGQVLREATLQQIGGRWMLIGKAVSTGHPDEWDAGLTVGIAWESVTAFYLFTQQQFDDKMKLDI